MTTSAGQVTAFDADVGLGVVRADARDFPFHCTQIADGSRSIAVGTEVIFTIAPGLPGRWEAKDLRPVQSP